MVSNIWSNFAPYVASAAVVGEQQLANNSCGRRRKTLNDTTSLVCSHQTRGNVLCVYRPYELQQGREIRVARKGKLMPHGRSARDQEQKFPNSLRSTVPEREFYVLPWTSPVVDICRGGIVQINKPSISVHNSVLFTMYSCIV